MRPFAVNGKTHSLRIGLWLGTLVAGLACCTGCSRAPLQQPATAMPPNVLLVTIEGLRADRIGALGAERSLTPVFDRVAGEGVLLANLIAVAPHATPAQASLLTGLLPAEHGLWTPAGPPLDSSLPTLAGVLREAGYDSGAFLADRQSEDATGLTQAFQHVKAPGTAPTRPAPWPRMRPRPFAHCPSEGIQRSDRIVHDALAWLQGLTGVSASPRGAHPAPGPGRPTRDPAPEHASLERPFFLWLHLADLHLRDTPAQTRVGGARVFDGYAVELAYIDLQIGRLIEYLDRAGLKEQTLVVVVGTHGFELGTDAVEDEALRLTDEVLHVPALLRWTGRIPGDRRLDTALSQVAIAPTILGLAFAAEDLRGVPTLAAPLERAVPRALLLGASDASPPSPPALFETRWPQLAYGLPQARGGTTGAWWWIEGEPPRPRSGKDAADDRPPDPDAWWRSDRLVSGLPTREAAPLPEAGFALPETADRAAFVHLRSQVARRMRNPRRGDPTLLEDCQALVATRPDEATLHTWLGIAHSLQRQTDEAVEAHRRALELDPGAPHRKSNLGLAFLDAQRVAEAIDQLENAYLDQPSDPTYRDNLATVLMHTGVALAQQQAFSDAVACMTRVLLLQPENPVAHLNMGSVYQSMGRKDLARTSYQRALELQPGFDPAERALRQLREAP